MSVLLKRIENATERAIYETLFLIYFQTLAEWDAQLVINAHGFPCWKPTLDSGVASPRSVSEFYQFNKWVRDACDTYLIMKDATPAGFVVLCSGLNVLPKGVDHELMDFFVLPKFRHAGVGEMAARLAFDSRHGAWIVYQLPGNGVAKQFWAGVIDRYTGGQFQNLENKAEQRFAN